MHRQARGAKAVSWQQAAEATNRRLLNRGSWRRVCIQARFGSSGKQIRLEEGKWPECLRRAVEDARDFAAIPGLVNWEIRRTGSGGLVAPGRPIDSDTHRQKVLTWMAAG